VAVLGGGLGGIAAAYELTATEQLRDRFEVVVYQQGWRIGGKGASGRNRADHNRIEEHGLHLFMGWYDQAFSLVRHCYDEWRRPANHPFRSWRDAFLPVRSISLEEQIGSAGWKTFEIPFPVVPGSPGDPQVLLDPGRLLSRLTCWLADPAERLGIHRPAPGARWHPHHLARLVALDPRPQGEHHRGLLRVLEEITAVVGQRVEEVSEDLRWTWILLRLGVAMAKGLALDVVPYGEHGWERINHLDLKKWLACHGAPHPEVSFSAPVRAFYDLAFAYLEGDATSIEKAQVAAGAAMRTLLRIAFGYRDAPLWRMAAGMGDTVFTPLYEVLFQRGVSFRFFRRVQGLGLSGSRVSAIELWRQADLLEEHYRPLFRSGGLDCWPSQPLWGQLVDGGRLKERGVDFESFWCTEHAGTETLVAGTDFDALVLGIPIGALPFVAPRLIEASPRWKAMVAGIPTVMTQSAQLWMAPELAGPPVGTAYVEPLASFADMSFLLGREAWGEDPPRSIEYLCGPLRQPAGEDPYRDPRFPPKQRQQVIANTNHWLATAARHVWPSYEPQALLQQYCRANVDPSERYVLTPPSTVGLRLDPADSGFDNLFPAGDWVRTSVNGGSAEAAVEGGKAAAAAILARYG
jgi:uncharacterized protein with NAD-binding domain and iron-sulfur cluster